MTPREALLDLVARVGARDGAAVRISETAVRQWPAEAIAALKAHRLLVRARPARTVVCPGCEADCVMPVQTIPARRSPGLSSSSWACAGAGTGPMRPGRGPSASPPVTRGTRCWACARTGT